MTGDRTPKPPLDHEQHAFTPRPDSAYCVCGLWATHHMHSGVSSADCTCMACTASRDGVVAAWGLSKPTFRDRLSDALSATPHFTVRETVATAMRVLAETLPCPICKAPPGTSCIRAGEHDTPPHNARVQAADAVLPVVEAETAALRASLDRAHQMAAEYSKRGIENGERAESAEDRLRKAEQAYTQLAERLTDAEATATRWRQRAEQAEAVIERALKFLDDTHVNFMVGDIEDDLRAILKPKETR